MKIVENDKKNNVEVFFFEAIEVLNRLIILWIKVIYFLWTEGKCVAHSHTFVPGDYYALFELVIKFVY